jgi:hypothetical protein
MRFIVLFILLFPVAVMAVADDAPPLGTNCQLTSSPVDAGELFTHGITMQIYPRIKDINSSYTGCQATFLPERDGLVILSLTEVVKGDPVRIWVEKDKSLLTCRYSKGKLIRGEADTCPLPQSLLIKSLAPGCVQLIKAAIEKDGLGAAYPSECKKYQ